jgi:NitT/TauT family transport system permease protein
MQAARSSWLVPIGSIIVGLLVWQLVDRIVNAPLLMAGPLQIARAIPTQLGAGLLNDIRVSALELAIGMAVSIAIGVSVGIAMALSPPVRGALQPWISALNSTPTIALAPVVILWFGLGIQSKVFVVALISVFPIIVNTEAGIREADRDLVEMARALRLPRRKIVLDIYLRGALPVIVAGIRLGTANGIIGVVVAELFGARAGLGHVITTNAQVFDVSAMFLAIAILAFSGIVLTTALKALERRLAPWRQ